ncbi:MAG: hypothetical protein IPN76_00545 [Saprospiraceae bacterium]|jgi:hypothetical protein|nr:hypothetical protein [Saprospiraceae bacterium]
MKIRMSGSSIRLRLSQSEVTKFFEHGEVSEVVHFGTGVPLTYTLKRDAVTEIQTSFQQNQITVLVPADLGNTWAASEQEIGLEHISRFATDGDGGSLRILVEKDFKCLANRPGEDESDNFPNPNLSC